MKKKEKQRFTIVLVGVLSVFVGAFLMLLNQLFWGHILFFGGYLVVIFGFMIHKKRFQSAFLVMIFFWTVGFYFDITILKLGAPFLYLLYVFYDWRKKKK